MWTAESLRIKFLNFFKEREHEIVPSSSLIPEKDPTLLFTTAGMVQFKPFYSGTVPLPFKRATSCQKCLRASDLDKVGYTVRHHTFFEMLGNFSFGDYFKKEAIEWAYEFVINVLNLPKERLYFSVYFEDEESFNIWKSLGVREDRILKMGKETNFWGPAGKTGACGPSTEIYYDLGENYGCKSAECKPGCDCDRYLEIWNIVFPQYDMQENGELKPLKNRGVDTGMGLERVLMILTEKESPYKTELFEKANRYLEKAMNRKYEESKLLFRIILDHTRALTFAIADGAYPSNEGRGYVLRRILRRALRFSYKNGIKEPFMYELVPYFAEVYGERYKEVKEKREEISIIIKSEEERFLNTIFKNMVYLDREIEKALKSDRTINGEDLFKLYDTYGIPIDFLEEVAKEAKINLDLEGFRKEISKAREKAKEKEKFKEIKIDWINLKEDKKTEFVGYTQLEIETEIIKYGFADDKFYVVLEKTPFYGEAGGQVGDKGKIIGENFEIEVVDAQWFKDQIVHIGKLKGEIKSSKVIAKVDKLNRRGIQRAHTATHILHSTLRRVLGEFVRQEGSLVENDRLRFDFTYPKAIDPLVLKEIEDKANSVILDNREVRWEYRKFDEAVKEAIALFEEKYGDVVRVVEIEDYSKELCGGTHCDKTGDIGLFKIIREESIRAGVRRIEALTGIKALEYLRKKEEILSKISEILSVDEENIPKKIEKLKEEIKEREKERERLVRKISISEVDKIKIKEKDGIKYVIEHFEDLEPDIIRKVSDMLMEKYEDLSLVFLVSSGEKIFFFSRTKEGSNLDAREFVKKFGDAVRGGGGGSKIKAEGGGKDKTKIKEGLLIVEKLLWEKELLL
ncbi:MAG: alanine--tRNA ligase [Candidatus Hydrothermales bacterium]